MRTHISASTLICKIEELLAKSTPAFHKSPLNDVISLVSNSGHYAWVGIYLPTEQPMSDDLAGSSSDPNQLSSSATRSKILVSMKLAGREIGILGVETDRENGFGVRDRVLLENVGMQLARFLAGPGKYLVRRARNSPSAAATGKLAATGHN